MSTKQSSKQLFAKDNAQLTAAEWERLHGEPSVASAIPESEAWEIALTWQFEVSAIDRNYRTALRLGYFSYDSIDVFLNSDSHAAYVRAAVQVWHWLSCCPGYSGRENERFWKRVFSQLQQPPVPYILTGGPVPLPDSDIDDTMPFFESKDTVFPLLCVSEFSMQSKPLRSAEERIQSIQVLLGVRESAVDTQLGPKLTEIFQRLEPYMTPSKLHRQVPVKVSTKDPTVVNAVLEMKPRAPFAQPTVPGRRMSANPLDRLDDANGLSDPRIDVVQVKLDHPIFQDGSASAIRDRASVLQQALGLEPTSVRAPIATLMRDKLPTHLLASICSDLPHSTTVKSLTIDAPRAPFSSKPNVVDPDMRDFVAMDWAWLGYAVFHPGASTSEWRGQHLDVDGITDDAYRVLRLMAAGNNLAHVESGGRISLTDSYNSARLLPGSQVCVTPSDDATVLVESTESKPVRVWLCACGEHEVWTRVVVACYGLGWVRTSEIVDVDARPPAAPCIDRLFVHRPRKEMAISLELIELLGANLESLTSFAHGRIDSAGMLRILRACPRLRSLSVKHNGSFWADGLDAMYTGLPRLECICVEIGRQPTAEDGVAFTISVLNGLQRACTSSHLRKLNDLSLTVKSTRFVPCRDAVVELLRAQRRLKRFIWSANLSMSLGSFHDAVRENRYIRERTEIREMLGPEGNALLLPHHTIEHDARLGLLSVMHAKRRDEPASAISEFDSNVLRLVFEFAATSHRLQLWINDERL